MIVALTSYCLKELPNSVGVTRAPVTSCLQIFICSKNIIKVSFSHLPSWSPWMVLIGPMKMET